MMTTGAFVTAGTLLLHGPYSLIASQISEMHIEDIRGQLEEFLEVLKQCKLQVNKKGVYCGENHKYLQVTGGPIYNNAENKFYKGDFEIDYCEESDIPSGTSVGKKMTPKNIGIKSRKVI